MTPGPQITLMPVGLRANFLLRSPSMQPVHKLALKLGRWFEASAEGWLGIGALMLVVLGLALGRLAGYW